MVKVTVRYIDVTDGIDIIGLEELDLPQGSQGSVIPKHSYDGLGFVRQTYSDVDTLVDGGIYLRFYKQEEDTQKTTTFVRYYSGAKLFLKSSVVGDKFVDALEFRDFTLVDTKERENVREYIYKRNEELEMVKDNKEVKEILEVTEEQTDAILEEAVLKEDEVEQTDALGVLGNVDVDKDLEEEELTVLDLVRDVASSGLRLAGSAIKNASKEQLVAGGIVATLVVFKIVRGLRRK